MWSSLSSASFGESRDMFLGGTELLIVYTDIFLVLLEGIIMMHFGDVSNLGLS